ncbi:MAG: hypothetical protein K1X35_14630 [Caulobacteraceae bacterium]|nr:hypothetical protein [Caulobacteraceae bacterium]
MRGAVLSLSLLALATVAAAAPERRLTVVNDAGVRLQAFYIAPLDQDSEDALGENVLQPGAALTLDLASTACLYEVRADFADGRILVLAPYDACKEPELRLSTVLSRGREQR